MRKAVVAGQFYPAEKEELQKEIESCFKNKLGSCKAESLKLDKKISSRKINIQGLISPHAGYVFSGPCASHGFAELLKLKKERSSNNLSSARPKSFRVHKFIFFTFIGRF